MITIKARHVQSIVAAFENFTTGQFAINQRRGAMRR
jgi:hypothetical protein